MARHSIFAANIVSKIFYPRPPIPSRTNSREATAVDNNPTTAPLCLRLSPVRLGLSLGVTGVVFYLGCMLTMAIVPHSQGLVLYNSMLHGFDVAPILRPSVPVGETVLGLVATFIGGGLAGGMIAGFYNWGLRKRV